MSGKEFVKIKNSFPDKAFHLQSYWPLYVDSRIIFYLMISSFVLHVRCVQSSIHSKTLEHQSFSPMKTNTCFKLQRCAVHQGIKNVCREPIF